MHDPERAPIVRRAFEEYATGRFTKQQILRAARRPWGLRNRRGVPLSSQAIGMLLRNQLYAGIVDVPEFGVRDKRGDFEPLVSEDVFYRAQAVLSGRAADAAPQRAQSSGLPAAQLRALRLVRTRPDGELVEGPQRLLRLLPLPARLPRRERDQGEARSRCSPMNSPACSRRPATCGC